MTVQELDRETRKNGALARAARIALTLCLGLTGLFGERPGAAGRQAAAATAASVVWPQILLTLVTSGLSQPVHITHAGDGSGRLFVVERAGRIRIFKNGTLLGTPFLDIATAVRDTGSEEGLLSVAFPPGFGTSKNHFYVYYVNNSGNLVIARYQVSAGNADLADASTEQIVLTVNHPGQSNHNGGQLVFGPNDGYLYLGTGDGGGGGDVPNNAQTTNVLLGKLLRIDVETGTPTTYTVPATNPYTQTVGYRPEIWALGLRNPWRFSFDRQTGDLYIGDVGQDAWEEVDYQPAANAGGMNYGWRCKEGTHDYNFSGTCSTLTLEPPVAEYNHGPGDSIGCSITGGFVYRGPAYAFMQGMYFYADYCTGRIWGLKNDGTGWQTQELTDTAYSISTFGEDEAGNLYLASYGGGQIYVMGDLELRTYLPLISK
jgi:glucose/arabinose dehydrogenase